MQECWFGVSWCRGPCAQQRNLPRLSAPRRRQQPPGPAARCIKDHFLSPPPSNVICHQITNIAHGAERAAKSRAFPERFWLFISVFRHMRIKLQSALKVTNARDRLRPVAESPEEADGTRPYATLLLIRGAGNGTRLGCVITPGYHSAASLLTSSAGDLISRSVSGLSRGQRLSWTALSEEREA
ncbi:hypothetical protein QQF64_009184 [Cirrhinus molitorella]|uniref:Uncharacterized protein n=1 Tax=Cirrhinus molitorella TaxID=172907 RepID=A0ABR3M0G4_9TELE